MRRVADQRQVTTMKARDEIGIDGTPQMHPGEISRPQKRRHRMDPVSYHLFYESAPRRSAVAVRDVDHRARHRETLRVELQVPNNMFFIDRQQTKGNAALARVKLIEIVTGPLN